MSFTSEPVVSGNQRCVSIFMDTHISLLFTMDKLACLCAVSLMSLSICLALLEVSGFSSPDMRQANYENQVGTEWLENRLCLPQLKTTL